MNVDIYCILSSSRRLNEQLCFMLLLVKQKHCLSLNSYVNATATAVAVAVAVAISVCICNGIIAAIGIGIWSVC